MTTGLMRDVVPDPHQQWLLQPVALPAQQPFAARPPQQRAQHAVEIDRLPGAAQLKPPPLRPPQTPLLVDLVKKIAEVAELDCRAPHRSHRRTSRTAAALNEPLTKRGGGRADLIEGERPVLRLRPHGYGDRFLHVREHDHWSSIRRYGAKPPHSPPQSSESPESPSPRISHTIRRSPRSSGAPSSGPARSGTPAGSDCVEGPALPRTTCDRWIRSAAPRAGGGGLELLVRQRAVGPPEVHPGLPGGVRARLQGRAAIHAASDANATKGECDQMVNTLLGGYSRVRDQDNGWMGGCQDTVTGKQPLLGVDRYERRSSTLASS
ncbi:MAG: hypothetical protein QOG28_2642 [Trebonia sp.]|nr:hypothetical protein [Trebonia sp.]